MNVWRAAPGEGEEELRVTLLHTDTSGQVKRLLCQYEAEAKYRPSYIKTIQESTFGKVTSPCWITGSKLTTDPLLKRKPFKYK